MAVRPEGRPASGTHLALRDFSFIEVREEPLMLTDRATRFLEAGMLLAVPVCVAITALFAVFALGA